MNRYYRYAHQELWYSPAWCDRISPIQPLVTWMGQQDDTQIRTYTIPEKYQNVDAASLPEYVRESESLSDPEVIRAWQQKGMRFTSRGVAGVHWMSLVPERAFADREDKRPTFLIFHTVDYSSPFWAMETLARYQALNDLAARENRIVLYIATNGPDTQGVFPNILQEALDLYPCDVEALFLDVSLVYRAGKTLRDVPGYCYRDRQGKPVAQPDACVEHCAGFEMLDISKRWEVGNSIIRDVIMKYKFNEGACDQERLVHSAVGKTLAEGLYLEHTLKDSLEPAFSGHLAQRGLRYEAHLTGGRRWLTLAPQEALEKSEKLPLLIVMHEVNLADDRLPLNAISYHTTKLCEIAGQGECMLLFFACECADDNELLVEILAQAKQKYPIDESRVYITGHSHNGRFSLEFTVRHPELIAAVAQIGNTSGHMLPALSPEAVVMTDEKLEKLRRYDIPFIVMGGLPEVSSPRYVKPRKATTLEDWARAWQRRLYSCHCPMKTLEQILAAGDSTDKATRILGIPNDRSETLFEDGYEHYIVDIKNDAGQYHLRIVGVEDTPHMVTPFMHTLGWSFLRRFARNPQTHQLVERY